MRRRRHDGARSPHAAVRGGVTSRLMFLPILSYADGYGFTYGARFSTVDLLGAGERLSVPLTWGGTRRAALEAERTFKRGPLTRSSRASAIWQRENPRFEIRRPARRAEGARRTRLRPTSSGSASSARAARWTSADSTIDCGRSARTPRSTRAAIPLSRPTRSIWARVDGAERSARAGPRSIATPRRARLSAPVSASRCSPARAQYSTPTRRCRRTSAAHRRLVDRCAASAPARSTAIVLVDVRRTARADHVGDQRRQARRHGVHGCREDRTSGSRSTTPTWHGAPARACS